LGSGTEPDFFRFFRFRFQVPNLIFSGFPGLGSGTEPDFFRYFRFRFRVVNRVTYPNLKPEKKSGTNTCSLIIIKIIKL
jgi:hypothetical protein